MKSKFILVILLGIILSSCVGVSSKGVFGTGVSVAFDPRTVGTQMDDSIMQKNLAARILLRIKNIYYQLNQSIRWQNFFNW
jgi:osmotically-inducible protein OsmY